MKVWFDVFIYLFGFCFMFWKLNLCRIVNFMGMAFTLFPAGSLFHHCQASVKKYIQKDQQSGSRTIMAPACVAY